MKSLAFAKVLKAATACNRLLFFSEARREGEHLMADLALQPPRREPPPFLAGSCLSPSDLLIAIII